MVKNFYIFRHGQSSYNVEGKLQGHSNNSVLTNLGIDQAYHAAHILKDKKIELIVSSPLRRAKQTGNIISRVVKVPIHYDDKLTEANLGIAEGMNIKDVQKKFAELFTKWQSPEYINIAFQDGETKKQIRERIFNTLNKYAAHSHFQNIAISGHSTILAQVLNTLGYTADNIPNGSVIHLQYDNGGWQFVELLH